MVQSGNNGWAPFLQEEEHHHSERKVGDPSSRNVTGDVVSSGPAAHGEHQGTHTWVQLSIQVEQFCALYCHPVGKKPEQLLLLYSNYYVYYRNMHYIFFFYFFVFTGQ